MKYFGLLACALIASLVPTSASADGPLGPWVEHRVRDKLLKPLRSYESASIFSRGRPPPHERRVRVLQTVATVDKNGRSFVPFAVDVRYGSGEWIEGDIVGCAYTPSGDLFIKSGDDYRPASFLLGKKADPVKGVCEAPSTP